MSFEIIIEDAAAVELRQAHNWYDEKSIQTAGSFQTEIEQILQRLKSDTIDYREVLPGVKMAPLANFPYNFYYRKLPEKEVIQIIAVLHAKRNPDFVSNRLSGA